MSDDLGRGQIGWDANRWRELDTMAADATKASVVMRNLVEHKKQPDARTVRIAGVDIGIGPLQVDFAYNMQNEDELIWSDTCALLPRISRTARTGR